MYITSHFLLIVIVLQSFVYPRIGIARSLNPCGQSIIIAGVNSSKKKKKKKKGKIFLFSSTSIFKYRREGKAREFTVLPSVHHVFNFASRPVNLNDASTSSCLRKKRGAVNGLDNFFSKRSGILVCCRDEKNSSYCGIGEKNRTTREGREVDETRATIRIGSHSDLFQLAGTV